MLRLAWATLRAMFARDWKGIAEMTAAVVIGFAVVRAFATCRAPAPIPSIIPALQATNVALRKEVDSLQANNVAITKEREAISAQRTAVQTQSTRATSTIRHTVAALPPRADTLADSTLRLDYNTARTALDSAVTELGRRDQIEASYRADSVLSAEQHTQDTISLRLRGVEIANVDQQRATWQAEAAKGHPLCGARCGAMIGVLGTIGAALALHAVAR